MTIEQVWSPILRAPDGYEASMGGQIRRHGKLVKLHLRPDGYQSFHVRGLQDTHLYVHRAVWTAFNGPIPKGMVVCHLNHQRDDNRLENLYMGTQAENIQQSIKDGRPIGQGMRGKKPASTKLLPHQTGEILMRYALGALQSDIATEYGITQVRVSQIIRSHDH